ncbi:hypothetical protein [Aureicoccus marinus]|jgi:hypothetical protein|uniref:hypothetical protein n=1 Tax=Aureicoccus marinus TaxID=754435 RepID=UPI0015E42C6C|nr:hypothetical protein [Aureicoccus marinus]
MKTSSISDQKLAAETARLSREPLALISKLMDQSQSGIVRGINLNSSLELDFPS